LGAPGDLDDPWVLSGLAAGERLTDPGCSAVVVGGFDKQPAGVRRAGFGDRSLSSLSIGGPLGRDDPEERGHQRRSGEAAKAAELGTRHRNAARATNAGTRRSTHVPADSAERV
jgi:hypothetical protein